MIITFLTIPVLHEDCTRSTVEKAVITVDHFQRGDTKPGREQQSGGGEGWARLRQEYAGAAVHTGVLR